MDRLLSLEPSNEVAVRMESNQRCYGELTLRNVMYTMPVAFRLQPMNRSRYTVRPESGIVAPLDTVTLEITYLLPLDSPLPESFPDSGDSFLLDSVVVPGAAFRDKGSIVDAVPNHWFTARKKQVFTDTGVRVFFVGPAVLAHLVAEGSMDRVREVLERSDPEWHAADSFNSLGQSLLHIAVSQCRADLVQLLLEFDPDVEARNRAGRTPLEAAAANGDALTVELLLARGASTEKSATSAWGPLHYAVAGGHAEATKLLLLGGADPDSPTADGRTALHLAAAEQRRDCLRMLLSSGGRADACGGPEGDTALHIAAAAGNEELVHQLLAKGGAGMKDVRNSAGRTAYDAAAEGGHGRLFDVLKLADGLAAAARKGEARAVGRAIERGAAANGRDQHGWTALMRAAFKGRVEAMRALMDGRAEVDARDGEGYTALHCAAEAGQAEAVEALVKRGADLDARTGKGATAMRIAESLGYAGITRILMQGGAKEEGGIVGSAVAVLAAEKKKKMVVKGKLLSSSMLDDAVVKKKGSRLSVGGGGGGLKGSFDRSSVAVASH